MTFFRYILGKSFDDFITVLFNFKFLTVYSVLVILWIYFLHPNIYLLIGTPLISIWALAKIIGIIKEKDGEKYSDNGIISNFFRILWNSFLSLIVGIGIILITFSVYVSASKTDNTLGIVFAIIGACIYFWYFTKIVFFPYCIVADGVDNPIRRSLSITENNFIKIISLLLFTHLLYWYEIEKMFTEKTDIVFFSIKVLVVFVTSLFISILYYNAYERLKEIQYQEFK